MPNAKQTGITIAAALLAATVAAAPAAAQLSDIHAGPHPYSLSSSQTSLEAGLQLRIPLGAGAGERMGTKADLRFGVSMSRAQFGGFGAVSERRSVDLFSLGVDEDLAPRLRLSGQDMSALAFPVAYAGEGPDINKPDTQRALWIAGGVAVVGAVFYVAGKETVDSIEDGLRCLVTGSSDDECED